MRIAVLCNDRLGTPALQQLAQSGLLFAVATSDRSPEMVAIMKQITAQARVPSQIFTRKNFEAEITSWLEVHRPDVVLVKTFPFRIPSSVLNIPKHGFINFHYAPLPEYRGPNPLFWMIRNGVTTGGIAVHRMDENFDSGPVLLQTPVAFAPDATFGICSTQLAYAGAGLLPQLIQGLQAGTLNALPQSGDNARWYKRPMPEDFQINWQTMNAAQIKALAKACNPWQKGALTRFNGWAFGITDASAANQSVEDTTPPGTILQLSDSDGCVIACAGQTALKAEVIYTEEGFFSGAFLQRFGLKVGNCLQ